MKKIILLLITIVITLTISAQTGTSVKDSAALKKAAIEQALIQKAVDSIEANTTVLIFMKWCYENITQKNNDELNKALMPVYNAFIESRYKQILKPKN